MLSEAALAAGRPGGATGQIRLLEGVQDALLHERYPGSLRSRLVEPSSPRSRAGRGGEGDAVLGDAAAEGAAREAANAEADAVGSGGPLTLPDASPKPRGTAESGSLRAAAPGSCLDEADAVGGLLGPWHAGRAGSDAPYDAALLHLARASGGEVPDQALRAARAAAAARDWPAAEAVLSRLPALRPLAVALAWDDLGTGRKGEGDSTGDQASGAAGNAAAGEAQERGAQHKEQGSADQCGLTRGGAGSFRSRRELLARLAESGSDPGLAPAPAGPAAATLLRLLAQLRWRLDLAEQVAPEAAQDLTEGRAAPAAPGERPRMLPTDNPRNHKSMDALQPTGAGNAPDDTSAGPRAPGPTRGRDEAQLPWSGAARGGALEVADERGWEGTAAAVLEELAMGRSALRVLRDAPRRLDERGLLAAVGSQPEMVGDVQRLCATCNPFAIGAMPRLLVCCGLSLHIPYSVHGRTARRVQLATAWCHGFDMRAVHTICRLAGR